MTELSFMKLEDIPMVCIMIYRFVKIVVLKPKNTVENTIV